MLWYYLLPLGATEDCSFISSFTSLLKKSERNEGWKQRMLLGCLSVPWTQGSQPYIKVAFKFTNTVKSQGYMK